MTYQSSSGGVPQPVQNSTNAIISLVMGILGLTLLPVIGSIVAVITGMMARKEIRNSQASGFPLGGEGMATAGLIMGWIGIGLSVVGCCVVAAIFVLPAILLALGSINWESGLLSILTLI